MFKKLLIVIAALLTLSACSPKTELAFLKILPADSQQAIVVTNQNWEQTTARLQRFEKKAGQWKKVGLDYSVQIGRTGLAWGNGLHQQPNDALMKKEGDGKAPAGIFALGNAFGYDKAADSFRLPYKVASDRDYYIDDVTSKDYNQWVTLPENETNTPKAHWQSFERMLRNDHRYEFGLEVEHNKSPVVAGNGSAIFLHVWKDQETPTAGCTAMSRDNMIALLEWLDPAKQPLLIQIPEIALNQLKIASF
jgi:L,D-peptidoglycan transpeptidase YkuD (ErfK/YbiS/YcfS/YnhG family)